MYIAINIHIYSAELTATKIIVAINYFFCLTIENNILSICFLLKGRSVGTGHPLTVECDPVLSHVPVPARRFEKPTPLELLPEGTSFNTLRY